MNEQDRVDEAWLLARARGESTEHPDPERSAGYVRLEQALGALPVRRLAFGWQDKVLGAINRESTRQAKRQRLAVAIGLAALATVLAHACAGCPT